MFSFLIVVVYVPLAFAGCSLDFFGFSLDFEIVWQCSRALCRGSCDESGIYWGRIESDESHKPPRTKGRENKKVNRYVSELGPEPAMNFSPGAQGSGCSPTSVSPPSPVRFHSGLVGQAMKKH